MEHTQGLTLVIIGLMVLAGYVAQWTGARIHIPKVTILLVIGAICSPSVTGLIPVQAEEWFPFVAHMALAMIGFLLGENFVASKIKKMGKKIIWITLGESLMAAIVVFAVLMLVGAPMPLALVLAGIAPASAPAAIFETVREGNAKGPLTDTLLGVVAIDDALGVVLFSILLVAAQGVAGEGTHLGEIGRGLWEVGAGIGVGIAVGFPMAWVTKRVRKGQPTLVEAAGFVFLSAGVASAIGGSYLLACMVMGVVVANVTKESTRAFNEIEHVREPFLAVFFVLAGYKFDLDALMALGLIGLAYIIARAAGLISGGFLSGWMSGAEPDVKNRIGFCILPQAGVALGFALLVQERLPDTGAKVLPLVIATTVLFEIIGPLVARYHLKKAGEFSSGGDNGGGA